MEERLQKILAQAGLGSRRACEELIKNGRVTVNGKIAILGSKAVAQQDHIQVDGKPIKPPEEFQYIALNKPRGVLSTVTTPDPRPTVRDLVPVRGTLYPVGRLDIDSEGLILLTNDGELANQLTHPRYGHEKEYRVLVARHPDEKQLDAWRHGVVMEDGYRTAPVHVEVESHSGKGSWLRVVMREGRKRQIRDTCHQIGLPVVSIIRIRIGSLRLGNLKSREWRHLTNAEINALKEPAKPAASNKHRHVAKEVTSRRSNRPYRK
jgi:23S rRNA pseudouridine2605 synthase